MNSKICTAVDIRRLTTTEIDLAMEAISALKIAAEGRSAGDLRAEYLRSFLEIPTNYLIVAAVDDKPVGFLVAYLLDRVDRNQRMMLLYEIGVDAGHRERGIGGRMIDLLKAECRKFNVMKMWVQTNASNAAAMALYRSAGGVADISGDEVSFLFRPESFGG